MSSSAAAAAATAVVKAPPQAGVLEGVNPVHFDAKNPIILFIVQASIIIIFCRLLNWPLSKIRQPRVISEIIGGIVLGPSVMGRIPGFKAAIFPEASMTNLNLVANIGLTLFLFIIGLEVDLRFLLSNWKPALTVGVASMAIPFGLGCAIAVGLYNEFKDEPGTVHIEFPIFMLFIGVAMAITAFPVLCRILTELELLMTPVGVIVLSAGVGNDVVGWVLLALCVALVNSGSGLTALWVLLTCAGYMLFLVYLVRPIFVRYLRKTRALRDGPSQSIIGLTLLIALGSAFFTGIIGVHPIFGAFMAGLICPHEGGFAIKVAEKIEDLIGSLFLPLYFTLSGLNTNIGLLDSGITWGYVFGVCFVAFFSKFVSATLAARGTKMLWRECFAIGSLMSCKGLVELIVLNIGLNAKILSARTFTIFVVMALVTTFVSSPLTAYFYPPWYQKKVESWRRGEIEWETGKPLADSETPRDSIHHEKLAAEKIKRLTIYLRLDSMPHLLAFTSLLGGTANAPAPKIHPSKIAATESSKDSSTIETSDVVPHNRPVEAYGLRLLNLTDRDSSVMSVSDLESYTAHDPVINTFRTFGRLHNLAVSGEVLVVPESSFAETLSTRASDSDFLILPWTETRGMSEQTIIEDKDTRGKLCISSYKAFVHAALENATSAVAVLISQDFGGSKKKELHQGSKRLMRTVSTVSLNSTQARHMTAPFADRSHHILFPFIGGKDDRAALRLVLHIAENAHVTATLIHFTTPTTLATDTAFFGALTASFAPDMANRVVCKTVAVEHMLIDLLNYVQAEMDQAPRNAGNLVVLGRNIELSADFLRRDAGDKDRREKGPSATLGVVAERVFDNRYFEASMLVVKAAL